LILRSISKFDATRCPILRLKCTKFDIVWGSAADPAYSAPPDSLVVFQGPTSNGREGEERGWVRGKGKRRGKGVKGSGFPKIFWPKNAPGDELYFVLCFVI